MGFFFFFFFSSLDGSSYDLWSERSSSTSEDDLEIGLESGEMGCSCVQILLRSAKVVDRI